MKEFEVIAHTLKYLIHDKGFIPENLSIRKISERKYVEKYLIRENIPKALVANITFNGSDEDIKGYFHFNQNRRIKRLVIEAKGGNIYYNIYTMLGQFLTMKKSPSSYYWFGFALPMKWENKIKNLLTHKDEVKPIIQDIIDTYTKNGQGLYFYFVDDLGKVTQKTWNKVLK